MIEKDEEERLFATAVQLKVQGQWTKWQDFVTKDLSWKFIWATPPELISFCIGATYDTLASPNNLVRWGLSSDKSCFLCSAPSCTVAHVLSGCLTSLKQGRYTYRHDAVLKEIASQLEQFISSVKSSNNQKKLVNKIKFVRPGYVSYSSKAKKYDGLLHLANDWVILVDTNKNLVFPGHIVLTNLRPDIVIFSNSTKKVILVELTCPCEENLLSQHEFKLNKYSKLALSCEEAGWICEVFAVEVGARGYSANSLPRALKRLGMDPKSVKSIIRKIETIATRTSFWIWSARETESWNHPINVLHEKARHHTLPEAVHHAVKNYPSKPVKSRCAKDPVKNSVAKTKSLVDVLTVKGFANLGNTCYMNATLQCILHIPQLMSVILGNSTSDLLKELGKLKSLTRDVNKTVISPKTFRTILMKRCDQFSNNEQQDAHEFANFLVNELCSQVIHIKNLMQSSLQVSISCDECFLDSVNYVMSYILPVPINNYPRQCLTDCIQDMLVPEQLTGGNKWNCLVCSKLCDATRTNYFEELPKILIIQLIRFTNNNGILGKNNSQVEFPITNLAVPMFNNNSWSNANYTLKAVTNHFGTLRNGHYTSTVFNSADNTWFHCDDSKVARAKPDEIATENAYLLFYVKNESKDQCSELMLVSPQFLFDRHVVLSFVIFYNPLA